MPNKQTEFEILSKMLKGPRWPKAVPDHFICDPASEEAKLERGQDILRYFIQNLKGKKFLDFGCGEGHVPRCAATATTRAVGYDLFAPSDSVVPWEEEAGALLLTTSLERVRAFAPYDAILLYDVLDHVESPVDVLQTVRSLGRSGTTVHCHCHPWSGRHGGHLYHTINKAFVHLVFSEEELEQLGYEVDAAQRVVSPQVTYQEWLTEAGFTEVEFFVDGQDPEIIFKRPIFARRLCKALGLPKFPKAQLRQSMLYFTTVIHDTGQI